MNQRNKHTIVDLFEGERVSLGIPDYDPISTPEGFALWEGDDLPLELPTNAVGLTSQLGATGSGLGRVQIAHGYRRPDGTYLTAALEFSDEGRLMLVANAINVRQANEQLACIVERWRFCGWEIFCRFAGADERLENLADDSVPISIEEWRSRRDSAA